MSARSIAAYRDAHPIVRSFHTGKYGFARIYDCVDLGRCIYLSEQAARRARTIAAKLSAYYEEENARLMMSEMP